MDTSQLPKDPPDWVCDAQPEVLRNLWLARFGNEWVPARSLVNDYFFVVAKLLYYGMAEKHQISSSVWAKRPSAVYRVLEEGQPQCRP